MVLIFSSMLSSLHRSSCFILSYALFSMSTSLPAASSRVRRRGASGVVPEKVALRGPGQRGSGHSLLDTGLGCGDALFVLLDELLQRLYAAGVGSVHLVENLLEQLSVAAGCAHAARALEAARRALRRPFHRDRPGEPHHRRRQGRGRRYRLDLLKGREEGGRIVTRATLCSQPMSKQGCVLCAFVVISVDSIGR